MDTGLRITRLRRLPVDTFANRPLSVGVGAGGTDDDGFPCHKTLVFDFPSLLEAHKRGIIPHLTGGYCLNTVVISELLLHEMDMANKKALHTLETEKSSEAVAHSNRVRDLLAFIYQNRREEWLTFQRKGCEEDNGFLSEFNLKENLNDQRRYISCAAFLRDGRGSAVMLVTSVGRLQECAEMQGIPTVSVSSFRS
ncbi:hypothetical protein DQ04_00221080 [Trypanosoma grayi]|uniref:hypothetical protein n=1 Tax=Trypanosoma grayi TaxID=71804 RepID=UPI0004F4638E|nr:hypothetical protein DQ04_00221080 [Trypanosoma grayi]KEG15005.1 hypothetical protein DQ04_00221080 [Trypanosoma grayi]